MGDLEVESQAGGWRLDLVGKSMEFKVWVQNHGVAVLYRFEAYYLFSLLMVPL